jgi:hypothetical protein
MNTLFRRMNTLFGEKISLFSEEQGIGCKLLNPLGDRLPKPPKEAGIVRNFQKYPVIFPVMRECEDQGRSVDRFDMIPILATPQEKHPLDPSHPYRRGRHRRHGGGAGAP